MTVRSFACVALALALLAPLPSLAGLITWGSATTISGDTDVVTTGGLVYAYNMGDPRVAATTVNGVTFAPFAIPNTGPSSVEVGFLKLEESQDILFGDNRFDSGSAPYSALSTQYKDLLGSGAFAGQFATITVTLGGLTNGQQYSVQWWSSDASLFLGSTRGATVTTATGVIDVALDSNTTVLDGGVGQYAVGTFTASGTSQTFDLTGSGGYNGWPLINGLQVRTSGPSPAPVPEVDPGLAGGAVSLATAVLAILERRRGVCAFGQ
jgi:hypothetical protein